MHTITNDNWIHKYMYKRKIFFFLLTLSFAVDSLSSPLLFSVQIWCSHQSLCQLPQSPDDLFFFFLNFSFYVLLSFCFHAWLPLSFSINSPKRCTRWKGPWDNPFLHLITNVRMQSSNPFSQEGWSVFGLSSFGRRRVEGEGENNERI